ncbi:DUF1816 domain-containing protein [Synechococcus sp. H55.7]|uniref:DUF1816 domain-containing protein n=1 Tax=unclassified Synechococcus TaxID=2626047 RepID=UPI0039C37E3A
MDPVSNSLTSLLDRLLGLSVWIEITTDDCTYYYGPFASEREAEAHKSHYIADLEAEGVKRIEAQVKKMRQPQSLTVARTPSRVGS